MALIKRSSLMLSEITEDDDQLSQLNEKDNLSRRKSVYPSLLGRRRSSRFSGHVETSMSRKFSRKYSRIEFVPRQLNFEATYRTEPIVKFHAATVQAIIEETLKEMLEDFEYSAVGCSCVSRTIVEEIKHRVKLQGYDRYKIVVVVVVGQNKRQGVVVTSRCTWEPKFDDFASSTYQNTDIFSSAQVFGIYLD